MQTEQFCLVSHGATLRVGLSQALSNVDYRTVSEKPMSNACYIKVETSENGLRYVDWGGESPPDE